MPLTGGETILLVEDEARVRKLIVDVLTGRGYRVLEATRGEEALRICRSHCAEIDLAVVDVVMPEMNGPELMRQMQPLCPQRSRPLYIRLHRRGHGASWNLGIGRGISAETLRARPTGTQSPRSAGRPRQRRYRGWVNSLACGISSK